MQPVYSSLGRQFSLLRLTFQLKFYLKKNSTSALFYRPFSTSETLFSKSVSVRSCNFNCSCNTFNCKPVTRYVTSLSRFEQRYIFTCTPWNVEDKQTENNAPENEAVEAEVVTEEEGNKEEPKAEILAKKPKLRGYEKDRSKVIPVEVSMRYLKSDAYKESYGDNLVWVLYRRNFKGQFAPKKTRKSCIRQEMLSTGNPCPICRDEYLVLDYRNVNLLKQFISPFNGEILSYSKTGLCQQKHLQLVIEVMKAKDSGTISFDVPFRAYDYSEYQQLYDSYKPT